MRLEASMLVLSRRAWVSIRYGRLYYTVHYLAVWLWEAGLGEQFDIVVISAVWHEKCCIGVVVSEISPYGSVK